MALQSRPARAAMVCKRRVVQLWGAVALGHGASRDACEPGVLDGQIVLVCIRPTEPAASMSIAVSHLLPCRFPAGVYRPADSCIAGANPAQAARWAAVGNRDMSERVPYRHPPFIQP